MPGSNFLDIKIDCCFKRVFGTERNKKIVIDMLNDIVVLGNHALITDVTFLKIEPDSEFAYQKQSIIDILCEDQNHNKTIIKMQMAMRSSLERSAHYYTAKAYCAQMDKGDEYHKIQQVIFLTFINHIMFPHKKAFKSDHVILDKQTAEHDLKDFSLTFVELPKFNKTIDELETNLDRWCYFFKHSYETREQELEQIIGSQISIERAYNEINQYNWTEEQYQVYESDLRDMHDWQAIEDARTQKLQAALQKVKVALKKVKEAEAESQQREQLGVQKGLEQGKQLGIEEGKQLGIEQGIEQGRIQERIEIAQQLFATGMNMEQVQNITQLPLGKLQQLQHANDHISKGK